jgi:hypothetical protein
VASNYMRRCFNVVCRNKPDNRWNLNVGCRMSDVGAADCNRCPRTSLPPRSRAPCHISPAMSRPTGWDNMPELWRSNFLQYRYRAQFHWGGTVTRPITPCYILQRVMGLHTMKKMLEKWSYHILFAYHRSSFIG